MPEPSKTTAESNDDNPSESVGDTPLSEVMADIGEGQFRSERGGTICCLTCRGSFSAASAGGDGVTRLEGESDPADMLMVVPLTCPMCSASGSLVLSYGPEATAEDADVLRTLDRDPGASSPGITN